MTVLSTPDFAVLAVYLIGVVGVGFAFARRTRDADRFMGAGRSLPGWAVGLSLFGSYVSSISFLANPGKSFGSDWNSFVFSLAIIPAAWIAVRVFVPFYRREGRVSAYEHLEHRFGPWARTYAVVCYLLTQMARMGTVVYLLALALAPLTGWEVWAIVVGIGLLMTVYTLFGGMEAVVWTGVLQSVVLLAGAIVCVVAATASVPGGAAEILRQGGGAGKFGLGSFGASLSHSTFWVVLAYGLVINLQNFGIDQSYVQRFITARSDSDASRSVKSVPFLYVPVAAAFFFVGTGLWTLSRARPEFFPVGIPPDQALPHFIAHGVPAGVRGVVVAAIVAAAMDSSLNSMATLTLCDVYRRYLRPSAGERESIGVLRVSMVVWGALGTGVALLMIRVKNALDAWWELAGLFGGGMLGLFLLGLVSKRAKGRAAAIATAAGIGVILWMTISPKWPSWRSPFHGLLTIVAGTVVILGVGLGVTALRKKEAMP